MRVTPTFPTRGHVLLFKRKIHCFGTESKRYFKCLHWQPLQFSLTTTSRSTKSNAWWDVLSHTITKSIARWPILLFFNRMGLPSAYSWNVWQSCYIQMVLSYCANFARNIKRGMEVLPTEERDAEAQETGLVNLKRKDRMNWINWKWI